MTSRFHAMTSIITDDTIHHDAGLQAENFWATTAHAAHHPCPNCDCCREDLVNHTACDIHGCPCGARTTRRQANGR